MGKNKSKRNAKKKKKIGVGFFVHGVVKIFKYWINIFNIIRTRLFATRTHGRAILQAYRTIHLSSDPVHFLRGVNMIFGFSFSN